jgi:hypothetical protein
MQSFYAPESLPEDIKQEIAEVAYSYWESRGHEDGHDVDDWLMAEQEVMRRHRAAEYASAA